MVGKLDLNLGEDYAFDIRRAREVAEGGGGGGGGDADPDLTGPFDTGGRHWWFDPDKCEVWFDIDQDPSPDVGVPVARILNSDLVSDELKAAISAVAGDAGCPV